ncbi:AAA family ATPase [Candidatus Micrarchaeota archaeon]|nr:AAA family ATPase [Candidatus Micrarchaeota archaeon]
MQTLFIGLTGTNASGKETVMETLLEKLVGVTFSLSDEIREEVRKRGLEINRDSLRTIGNELREKFGSAVLAERVAGKAQKEADKKVVVFVSIRNPAEVDFFRKRFGKSFVLVSVDAPLEIRYERAKKRRREGEVELSIEEFREKEVKEMSPNAEGHEQSLQKIIEMADYTIINDGGLDKLEKEVEKFIRKYFY